MASSRLSVTTAGVEGHIPCVIVFANMQLAKSVEKKKKSPEDMQIRPEPWILRRATWLGLYVIDGSDV